MEEKMLLWLIEQSCEENEIPEIAVCEVTSLEEVWKSVVNNEVWKDITTIALYMKKAIVKIVFDLSEDEKKIKGYKYFFLDSNGEKREIFEVTNTIFPAHKIIERLTDMGVFVCPEQVNEMDINGPYQKTYLYDFQQRMNIVKSMCDNSYLFQYIFEEKVVGELDDIREAKAEMNISICGENIIFKLGSRNRNHYLENRVLKLNLKKVQSVVGDKFMENISYE